MPSGLQALIPELVHRVVEEVIDNYAKQIARKHRQVEDEAHLSSLEEDDSEGEDILESEDDSESDENLASEDDSETEENLESEDDSESETESDNGTESEVPEGTAWKDLASLAQTCRNLYCTVTPLLYRYDAQLNFASALHISSRDGNLAAVRRSLDNGASPDTLDHTNPPRGVRKQGFPVYDKPRRDWTPLYMTALHWAVVCRHEHIVKILIEGGANVNHGSTFYNGYIGAWGYRMIAVTGNYHGILRARRWLRLPWGTFKEEADPLSAQEEDGWTMPLFYALACGNNQTPNPELDDPRLRIARRLIEAGASLVTNHSLGIHAMHQAVLEDAPPSFIEFLLKEKHADPNSEDALGCGVLHYLCARMVTRYLFGSIPGLYRDIFYLTRLLVQYGVKLDRQGGDRPSALLRALGLTGEDIRGFIFILLANGARLGNCGLAKTVKATWLDGCDQVEDMVPEVIEALKKARGNPNQEWDENWERFCTPNDWYEIRARSTRRMHAKDQLAA